MRRVGAGLARLRAALRRRPTRVLLAVFVALGLIGGGAGVVLGAIGAEHGDGHPGVHHQHGPDDDDVPAAPGPARAPN
jgi:hypothetical protein